MTADATAEITGIRKNRIFFFTGPPRKVHRVNKFGRESVGTALLPIFCFGKTASRTVYK